MGHHNYILLSPIHGGFIVHIFYGEVFKQLLNQSLNHNVDNLCVKLYFMFALSLKLYFMRVAPSCIHWEKF